MNNMTLKLFVFVLAFLLVSCDTKNKESNPHSLTQSPTQKLADTPKDTIIKVIDESGQLRCYMPNPTDIYVLIGTCRTSWAKPARYDVFGRIAYNIEDSWFCLSAQESVATTKRANKDYLILKPCVINDKKQQWKIKNNLIYGIDESYFIKDDGAYVYVANARDSSLKTSKLDGSMQEWIDTIASPVNLSILTFLAWDYTTNDGTERYFLYNNASDRNTTDLYYNLESGHIAQYDGYRGLNCLYADLNGSEWNWAWWDKCTDAKAPSKDKNKAYWNFVRINENESLLTNFQGAALCVTQNGIHWGEPYVVSPKYFLQDSTNSPTSRFIISGDMQEWLRFIYANVGDNLPYCPAPNNKSMQVAQNMPLKNPTHIQTHNIVKNPPLPSDFTLNDEWRARLLAIVNTNNHEETAAGVCGVCLLQSFQIMAELLQNPQSPPQHGGYFFDTQEGANPFVSFEARNSLLYATLNDLIGWFPRFVRAGTMNAQIAFEYNNDLAMMSAIALLPQYNWRIIQHSQGSQDVARVIDSLLTMPSGSAFVLLLRLRSDDGQEGGHAMVALRTRDGLVLVPTNVRMDEEEFSEFVMPLNTREDFLESFSNFGFSITNIALLSADGVLPNTFANTVSLNNCTGDGEDRRGSGMMPQSAFVNQCASGRCVE